MTTKTFLNDVRNNDFYFRIFANSFDRFSHMWGLFLAHLHCNRSVWYAFKDFTL